MRAFQVLLVLVSIAEVSSFLCSSQNSCLRNSSKHETRHAMRCRMSTGDMQQAAATSSLDSTNAGSPALASRRSWTRNAIAATAALLAAAATQADAAELSLTNRIAELQASEAMTGWVEPEITSRAFMRLSVDGVPAGICAFANTTT
jgi:hypothetical protein